MAIPDMDTLIWTGSYTADNGGMGSGIGAIASRADGRLTWLGVAAVADSPSFLATHPWLPVVYAVCEKAQIVRAYRRTAGFRLEAMGNAWPAGPAACHVAVDPHGRFLVVACWGDGQVLLYELDKDGGIVDRFAAAAAVDPHDAGEKESGRPSRAHASLMLQDHRVMTTDLGRDLVRVWCYVPGAGLLLDHEVVLPKDSGPRHLVQHESGNVLVVTECSIQVAVLSISPAAGHYALISYGPATFGGAQDGDAAAEIALAPDGRHAYVGVRGSNRISVLAVQSNGTQLRPLADIPSGGDWPRHHLVRDGQLHVAHERSGDVATFALNPETGMPGTPIQRLRTGSPTALVIASVM